MIPDYSDSLLTIQAMRKKARDAAAEKNWSLVCDIADTIIDTALRLKVYSVIRMEEEC